LNIQTLKIFRKEKKENFFETKMSMNDKELSMVQSALGSNCQILMTTIARLYISTGSEWKYMNKMGALALVTERGSNYFKMVDLKSRSIIFDQELYEAFDYQKPRPFFHTFELDDCVAGFSFANENEASQLHARVTSLSKARAPPSTNTYRASTNVINSSVPIQGSNRASMPPSNVPLTTANWKPVNVESNQPVYMTEKEKKKKAKEEKKKTKK